MGERKVGKKMNFFVVLQQMLALFAMIFIGFYAYKVHWVTQDTSDRLSKLLVNILNPALLINGVLDKTVVAKKDLLLENLFYIFLYFVLLIGLSFPIAKVLRVGKMENRYQLMLIFSNVGFMGIPVLRSIFGNGCVIYITFAQRSLPKEERKNAVKEMINPGTVSAVFAILIFVFHPNIPQGAVTFFNYVGNAVIPFSMIIIGISIAQMPWKEIFGHVKLYIFSAIKLLVIPILCAILLRPLKRDTMLFVIFILMLAMPSGSIIAMIVREYGGKTEEEDICSKGVLMTTLFSIITIPIVVLFL